MTRARSNSLPFWFELPVVFLLGLMVRIAFIHVHPAIYGGDTLARIMNADRVLLAYQLPLLQLLIYLVNLVSSDPLLIRYLMSLVGALAGAAFYLLSATLLDRPTARLASLFFIFNPFLLVHSIVPYQEILMLLALCLGLYFLVRPDLRGSIGWASLYLGLACLTRYESWVVTAAAGLYYAREKLASRSTLSPWPVLGQTTILFGWAPLLWILLHHGVSPQGTYVLEGPATWARLWRIPYVTAMALYHAGPVVGVLAGLGLLTFWKASLWRKKKIQMVLTAAALLMLSLIFSAHGVEPDPQRYVTDREAHWFVLFAFWAGALGLSDLKQRSTPSAETSHAKPSAASRNLRLAFFYVALILAVVWGAFQTDRYVKRLLADQNLILDYAVAQYLEKNLPHGSKALVFAKPLPPNATQEYFDKVYSQGGNWALELARRQLAELNSGPLDYSRVAVNTRFRKTQILDASKLIVNASDATSFFLQNRVRLAAVYSNYPAQEVNTRHLLEYVKQRGKHQATLADRGLQVSIYEVRF
jgi:hypothetical protein